MNVWGETVWKLLEWKWYVLMILEHFLMHSKILTATSSPISCEFYFDVYIIRSCYWSHWCQHDEGDEEDNKKIIWFINKFNLSADFGKNILVNVDKLNKDVE